MKKVQIVLFNVLVIGLCSVFLFDDGFRQNTRNTILAFSIFGIGLISIFTQFNLNLLHSNRPFGKFLKLINGFYGVCLILVAGIVLWEFGLNDDKGFMDEFFSVLCVAFVFFGYLGVLILIQVVNIKKIAKLESKDDLLDDQQLVNHNP